MLTTVTQLCYMLFLSKLDHSKTCKARENHSKYDHYILENIL